MRENRLINLVSSYPKSGATWFRFIMYACFYGEIPRSSVLGPFYPEIHQRLDLIEAKLEKGEEVFVKSHFPYFEELPYLNRVKRSILLVRHPLDTIVSKLNHYRLHGSSNLDREAMQKNFILNEVKEANKRMYEIRHDNLVGGWNYHVKSWLNSSSEVKPYIIKYEDLLSKPIDVLNKMSTDLSFEIPMDRIKRAVQLSEFSEMKKLEKFELENEVPGLFSIKAREKNYKKKGLQFVNRGKSGYYKEYFDDDMLEAAKLQYADTCAIFGYEI